jgi:thymidylate kinase
MLIVEGCDGVGKTTICKALLKQLPTHIYAHFTRLPIGFNPYWGYVERMSMNIVQDRFHMSEPAYARARGEVAIINSWMYNLIDARLRLLGGFTILVTADDDLIRERWHKDQMFSLEKTLSANAVYNAMAKGEYLPYKVDIDYHVHCTKEHPYVTEATINEFTSLYRQRRTCVRAIEEHRPKDLL